MLDGWWIFVEMVEERLGDLIKIEYLGGADVIPAFDQFEAIGTGVVDIGWNATSYAVGEMPVADAMSLIPDAWKAREAGILDLWREVHKEKLNVFLLGLTGGGPGGGYSFFTNFEVNTLEDFKGKDFRVAPMYIPFLEALGAGVVSIPPEDVYTALERGVVDGIGWPSIGVTGAGYHEVIKYRIVPEFWHSHGSIVVNYDTWASLPEDLRKELDEIATEVEKYVAEVHNPKVLAEETKELLAAGVIINELKPEVAQEFLRFSRESVWEHVLPADPIWGPKLQEAIEAVTNGL